MEPNQIRIAGYKYRYNDNKRVSSTNPLFANEIIIGFDSQINRYSFREAGIAWRGKTHKPLKQGRQYFWGMTLDVPEGVYNLIQSGDELILQL